MTSGIIAAINVLLAIGLCWTGSWAYRFLSATRGLDRELTVKDNTAFALPYGGFLLGIITILGGPWTSPDRLSTVQGYITLVLWGVSGLVFLIAASWIQERMLFHDLDLWPKVIKKGSISAGIILAGSHLAAALIIRGALSDEGGPLPALVFWVYAELLLLAAIRVFLKFSHYHLASELKRDNRAVALAFTGGLVAVGNLLGFSIRGAFLGWSSAFAATTGYALAALAFLYVIHLLTDLVFFPKVAIFDEIVTQETPNIGVGYLVFVFYVGLSFLVGWSL